MHFERSIKWKGERLGILEMRRHYANYFKGFINFKPYRQKLVHSMDISEIKETLLEVNEVFSQARSSVVE